jgi:hypothetical protein
MPIPLYFTNGPHGFFNERYTWWVMIGGALLLGLGLSRLPRIGRIGVAALLAVFAFLPIPLDEVQIVSPPIGQALRWLTGKIEPGDALLIDPNCACGADEVWEYYMRVYFPRGLPVATSPDGFRRVWYVTGAAGATADVAAAVNRGRIAGEFYGPPESLLRLYQAPPNPAGVSYANGMRFHGMEWVGVRGLPVWHEGETVRLRLWWSAARAMPLDYSVGIFVRDSSGAVIAQSDSAPQIVLPADSPHETSRWQPGALYVEERAIALPFPLARGVYTVDLAVYWYGDQVRIDAPGVDADGLLNLATITVISW